MRGNESDGTRNDADPDYESVFQADDYLYFYEDSLTDEFTEQEIGFLVRELSLEKRMKILDFACGHGRHANRLAALGYAVTGVDRSRDFLAIADDDAKRRNVTVRYLCADVRKYMVVKEYDRVVHLYSSFGYFSDADNGQVLRNIAASLRPDGQFCFDILNRDASLRDLPRCAVREKNRDLMIDRNRFDPITGRLHNARIIIRNGQRRDAPFFLRLYNPIEIVALLEQKGLHTEKIFGDWTGTPFDGESKRMIIVAGREG